MNKLKKLPWVTLTIILSNLVVFFAMVANGLGFSASSLTANEVLGWGANFNPFTLDGDSWRIFSSMFVHGGYAHLAINMIALYFLGSDLENYVGKVEFGIIYILCGIGGGLGSLWWNVYTVSVGASGAIFGLYGFNLVVSIIEEVRMNHSIFKLIINFVLFVVVNLIFGEYMNVDHAGHFGGLFAGIFIAFYREIRTYFSRKIPLFADGTVIFLLIYALIFGTLSRSQVEYYKAFQDLLKKEELSSKVLKANYSSDAVYLDSLRQSVPIWTETLDKVLQVENLPYELALDQLVLLEYCSLRREGLQQRVNSLEEESYIYWDSVEVVNESIGSLPGLRYILNYEPAAEKDTSQNNTSEQGPVLIPVKEFYDSNWKLTEDLYAAEYYRIGQQDSLGKWQGKVRDYYKDGSIQMKGFYEDGLKNGVFLYYSRDSTYEAAGVYNQEIKIGKWEYFHDNGKKHRKIFYDDKTYTLQVWDTLGNLIVVEGNGTEIVKYDNDIISETGEYKEGLREGIWYGYYENGKPFFEEFYDQGELQRGKSYDSLGKLSFYDYTTNFPKPTDGIAAFQNYLDEFEFAKSLNSEKSGKMTVIFQVNDKGELSDFRFKDSPGPLYEMQAIQLLKNGPKWIPAKQYAQLPFSSETLVKISYP